jgi:hypothetical protein
VVFDSADPDFFLAHYGVARSGLQGWFPATRRCRTQPRGLRRDRRRRPRLVPHPLARRHPGPAPTVPAFYLASQPYDRGMATERRPQPTSKTEPVCSIERTLAIIGDRWTMLVLRDALIFGSSRFAEFERALGIAPTMGQPRYGAPLRATDPSTSPSSTTKETPSHAPRSYSSTTHHPAVPASDAIQLTRINFLASLMRVSCAA